MDWSAVVIDKGTEPILERCLQLLTLRWWRRTDGRRGGCAAEEVRADDQTAVGCPLDAGTAVAKLGEGGAEVRL